MTPRWRTTTPTLKQNTNPTDLQSTTKTLTAETVQGTALSLERIHHIHGGHSLPASVLSVGDGISDNIFQKDLENATCLFIDQTADTLHTSSASQSADSWLGDSLNVVTKNLTVSFCSSLSQSLASLTTA
ncbi:hypothetical protein HanIR_Chr06g0275611 [Helianthus annuus]|nr:hypothetical protein HanIR_Chr06g0275611 [Helianthus annuus]